MPVKIFYGNVGSGKTAMARREMGLIDRPVYTNINVYDLDYAHKITGEHIIKKTIIGHKKRSGHPIYKYGLNEKFWRDIPKPIDIYLDEMHNYMDARRSTSRINVLLSNYMSMIRRIVGDNDDGVGDGYFISQFDNRLDRNLRQMAHQVRYHICHFIFQCRNCGWYMKAHSDMPELPKICPSCGHVRFRKTRHKIEVFRFASHEKYEFWKYRGLKTYYRHYIVNDIQDFLGKYERLQWDDMFKGLYDD